MPKTAAALLSGDLLTVQTWEGAAAAHQPPDRTFLLEVKDGAAAAVLLASLSMLDRLLAEKTAEVRERRLAEMVDFMAERMAAPPSPTEVAMAQRLAARHARVLDEFGWFTAEQLADANRSQAASRSALADNWRKRRQVFAVPHPDRSARGGDVYPAFQFRDHKPIKAVQAVLEAFGERKTPWKLALWFTSAHGALPDSARPVDLLVPAPQAVIEAARRDAAESAA